MNVSCFPLSHFSFLDAFHVDLLWFANAIICLSVETVFTNFELTFLPSDTHPDRDFRPVSYGPNLRMGKSSSS